MISIENIKTKNTKGSRRIATGEISTCCHTVDFYYDIGGAHVSDENLCRLEEEAERRSTELISQQGYVEGELCCHVFSQKLEKELEFYGGWAINRD